MISVLAIDDSLTIRELLRQALEGAGMTVTTADDGALGVSAFHKARFDAVITDINMPNLDGFGVIEAIRRGTANKRVPILVLTTETGPSLRARAREAGATGWLTKPFDQAGLIQTVRRVAGASL
jgi:two-component system, chemotaxis family, chemotaxis protein CheY